MTSAARSRPGPKAYLFIALFAFALVLLPFLFWYQTWFGRKLTDSQIDRYFADGSNPRHAQHALVQLGERLTHGRNISRWRPNILEAAASPVIELRQTAAWLMGQDRGYPPFHDGLLRLIHDPEPNVRRNAALALAAYGDAEARPELLAMLHSYEIAAPSAGVLRYRLKAGEYVNGGTLVAHIGQAEVRSPLPGEVEALERSDGATIAAGEPIVSLLPDKNHVWESLRALYLVGRPADLEQVERFTRPFPGMSENVRQQAALTAQALRTRQSEP